MKPALACGVAVALLALSMSGHAEPIVAPSTAELEALRARYEVLEDNFATRENGLFLDPIVDPTRVAEVEAFFAQSAVEDFETFNGSHPFAVLSAYDEHGDEGNFAGIASVGVAARLLVLRAEGAPAADIDRARAAAIRSARAWHAYGAIGGPGVVARGVRRIMPEPGDPALPGTTPELVPLADGSGNPLPKDKVAVWRAPVAAGFEDWIWFDDTSKDQVSGYALAVAWLYDALANDAEVPAEVTADLANDLALVAKVLMLPAPEVDGIDLCIRDADGRLTRFHDLNPRLIAPGSDPLPETSILKNGFNGLLALGIIRAAYHVSGDPEIGAYYYEELVGRRLMAEDPTVSIALMYLGAQTNYSNVNMAAIGLATLGRFETDSYVRERLGVTIDTQFWSTGSDRDASHVEQAWFDAIVGAYSENAPRSIPGRVRQNLAGFPPPPGFNRDRINCDEVEIAAHSCLAIDGTTTLELLDGTGHNGQPVASAFLPMAIRPDSDFHWRSDPHSVNGAANNVMAPRGDWLAAYWLARLSQLGQPDANISPLARPALPYELGPATGGGGGGTGAGGGGGGDSDGDGCGCRVVAERRGAARAWLWLVGLSILAFRHVWPAAARARPPPKR